jgi:hypothetical protein
MLYNLTGNHNTAYGYGAVYNNASESYNSGLGYRCVTGERSD